MKEHPYPLLNHPVDVSRSFSNLENTMFLPEKLDRFDARKASGDILWGRYAYKVRMAFNQEGINLIPNQPWEFPSEYGGEKEPYPFSITFYGNRTLRLRFQGRKLPARKTEPSLMLAKEPKASKPWKITRKKGRITYQGPAGSVTVVENPWALEIRDASGKLLTKTQHLKDNRSLRNTDPLPFCFQRPTPEYGRQFAATFALANDEKIYGCGESFTRLNKRGQKVVLWSYDAHGVQHDGMYKPVPFFMSSRGYGMFLHTTAPATFDFGHSYGETTTLFTGDENLDLFIFLGGPKEVLSEYTTLTGRSPVPPLWSFGLWMSKCTYKSEKEARDVAGKLRGHKIPSDVVHLDTGWFEEDWRCDYRFSTSRFQNPLKMIKDLAKQGFKISLWQLSYFNPKNRLFKEILDGGMAVTDGKGNLPTEDATLDFTNPKTVKWYQRNLAGLLKMGVGAIKVDFGEAAPLKGVFHNGKTGFAEHNLYPLRYNKAAAEVTKAVTGENIIWARSAWAGSQRYPLHWGGDAECTYGGMQCSLRGGLSLGLSGFSFWSHDIGGFVNAPTMELYRRWAAFGLLTSHSRCHGMNPREPWVFGKAFEDNFRQIVEMKYKLMPYVYAQAVDSSKRGFPMLRTLFFEFPEDPTSWLVEDEYMFGSNLLVAPLMEEVNERNVYLPPGQWVDYQTHHAYRGGQWYRIKAGAVPCVILVREGSVIPHVALAQSTSKIDWSKIELRVFSSHSEAQGLICFPKDKVLRPIQLVRERGAWKLPSAPSSGRVKYTIQEK
ncbi:MAG TPA: TIM-barrel domain-containing protein [bacterium]|nr:TIM-barrel domain-containing protein [bacterium]